MDAQPTTGDAERTDADDPATLPPGRSPAPDAHAGDAATLAATAIAVLDAHWQPDGYAVPNADTYPHQWLWDSCFHAVVWARCGHPDRAVAELHSALAHQGPDGFVPHMTYWSDPQAAAGFWGRPSTSCITQPPMYGHAVAELAAAGVAVPSQVVDAAAAGLGFLLGARRAGGAGGVRVVHPWETGCDDSPRWDRWCAGTWTPQSWRQAKGDLVAAVAGPGRRGPTHSPAMDVEPAGFSALVAYNARQLAGTGLCSPAVATSLATAADEVAAALADRWVPQLATWADTDHTGAPTSQVRTLDAVLGALVVDDDAQCAAALATVTDPDAFAGRFGPAGVHRREPAFDPDRYWRGPAWPQLGYLVWLAARRAADHTTADAVAAATAAGAVASGWAEFWNPDSAVGHGASPQSWTGLAAVMA